MSLLDSYNRIVSTLKPQIQGTCGLYSFWYATLLLTDIDPTNRTVVYPRAGGDLSLKGKSLRSYAKNTFNSGQGEVLTSGEMTGIISHYGYHYDLTATKVSRQYFITTSLANNKPIIFPYMMGNTGPISMLPFGATPNLDYGSHWSLIIGETTDEYLYIEPNSPNTITRQLKKTVLDSNTFVDDFKYDRFWYKTGGKGTGDQPGIYPAGSTPPTGYKYYDIGQGGRDQKLTNLLIAVY